MPLEEKKIKKSLDYLEQVETEQGKKELVGNYQKHMKANVFYHNGGIDVTKVEL